MIEIIPAIDLIGGRCVRLCKGSYERKTVYDSLPLDMAKRFADAGASWLHLVDLDGAKASKPLNLKVLDSIVESTDLKVEWGGGIKSFESLKAVLDCGATRVVCGSVAVEKPEEVCSWLKEYGSDRIVLGADVRGGLVATRGWLEDSNLNVGQLVDRFLPFGIKQVVCTDISKDGTLEGPSWDLYRRLKSAYPGIVLTVSGGVSSVFDLECAVAEGLDRIIVGKAFYEGIITLEDLKIWWRKE